MCLRNRKIVLLLNNFSGHNIDYSPTNIRLEFFTPNMMAFVQPLNVGIIHCFKAHYQALFCRCTLDLDTISEENIFEINICKTMLMAKDTWDAVQPTTYNNQTCWDHTGIQCDPIMLHIPVRNDSRHKISLKDLATSWKTLPESEESLEEIYGGTYKDSIWWCALVAITALENNGRCS